MTVLQQIADLFFTSIQAVLNGFPLFMGFMVVMFIVAIVMYMFWYFMKGKG